jgi:pyridoxine/pyridoxamine 5'-phosphate oxidase
MTQNYFQELSKELKNGVSQKGHAFRYFTLATVGLDQVARLRTIILRKVSDELQLTFYTDSRSKKMIHLQENKKVGLLFYNPKNMMQIRIEGLAKVVKDEKIKENYWDGVKKNSRKDYMSTSPPGTILNDPNKLEYLDDEDHFCIVEITPFKIEYLKLKSPNHIRVRYSREVDFWESEFLVP